MLYAGEVLGNKIAVDMLLVLQDTEFDSIKDFQKSVVYHYTTVQLYIELLEGLGLIITERDHNPKYVRVRLSNKGKNMVECLNEVIKIK